MEMMMPMHLVACCTWLLVLPSAVPPLRCSSLQDPPTPPRQQVKTAKPERGIQPQPQPAGACTPYRYLHERVGVGQVVKAHEAAAQRLLARGRARTQRRRRLVGEGLQLLQAAQRKLAGGGAEGLGSKLREGAGTGWGRWPGEAGEGVGVSAFGDFVVCGVHDRCPA